MKIVHVNIRLSEGGAARIAATLHFEALRRGHDVKFIYGYGKGGHASTATVPGSIRGTRRFFALANYGSHKISGRDLFLDPELKEHALSILEEADVVHLHAIHSHMLPYQDLFKILQKTPIVWTHHDYWAITGRCAIPGSCAGWNWQCNPCSNKAAYPSTLLDFAKKEFARKRRLLKEMKLIRHIAPSRHLATLLANELDCDVAVISNGVDEEFCTATESVGSDFRRRPGVLVVANDLSDRGKNDFELISQVAKRGIRLETVGNNSPFIGNRVVNHGPISDRRALANIYDQASCLLFTSKVDNQPLVLMEALCAGVPVLWTESAAARELLETFNVRPVKTADDIQGELFGGFPESGWGAWRRGAIKKHALQMFAFDKMAQEYMNTYASLCDRVC